MSVEARVAQVNKLLWLLAGVALYLSFGYTEMQGSDLWWHLAAGREIVQSGTLWLHDRWSFTATGTPWMNHEWLTDILYYCWISLAGLNSLVYWKWLVVISTYTVLQIALTRNTQQPAAALFCAGLAAAVAAPFIDVRPHLYSLLGFSLLIFMLLNRTPSTWKLALLFVVWVNLHGGFIFGLMGLAILVFPWRDLTVSAFTRPAWVVCVCTLACLANPDGINAFVLPLTYALDSSSPYRQLAEWLPPFRSGGIQSPLFVWLAVSAPVVALAYALPGVRRATGIPWEGLALCALTLLMALTSRRFITLFATSWAVMSAPLLGQLCQKLKVDRASLAVGVLVLAYAIYRLLPYPLSSGAAYHYLTAEYTYPIDMLDYIEAHDIRGNVFALYNWGGYIHWRTDGKLKVFIDGRANTVYGNEPYHQYVAVIRGVPGWLALVESTGADYFLWPYHSRGMEKFQLMMASGRWQLVYQDSVSYLMARNAVQRPSGTRPPATSPYQLLSDAYLDALRGNAAGSAIQAERVLAQIPYQKGACHLAAHAHRQLGDTAKAEAILVQCRAHFPSKHIR